MKNKAKSANPDRSTWAPLLIASGYLVLGALWILFSDTIAESMAPTTEALSQISIYKGWGYVLVTAILLFWLINRHDIRLREANQRYRLIAENALDVIWLLDPLQGKFKYISPSVLKLRGYTTEEAMSMPLDKAYIPEDFERLIRVNTERLSLFQAGGSGTISYTDEIRQPHRDGSLVHTEVTTTYFFNEQNEIEIMGVSRDITRRKEAELQQRSSEKKYQELLDQASDGIFVADPSGRYTLVNEQACQLVGYTKDELLAMNLRELVAPEDLQATPLRLDELRAGKTLITERTLLRKDETRIICEISAKMLPNGSFQSIIRDITDRKVTEEALIRSEKRYRSLFENMSNGYARCQMVYDEAGKPFDFIYLDINRAFRQLTGLQDVIGRRVSEVVPGIQESNPELFEIYGRVAHLGKPESFETYVPGMGSGIWFSISVYSPERDFFVAIFEVITKRKQADESLQRSYRQLLSFIEQAPLSIAMFDREMNYLATSHRWIAEYGRGHSDLLGLNHYEVFPDMPDHWKEAHQKGIQGEASKNDDDLWVQANGTKNWLRWAVTPWSDDQGRVAGIIISAEDISERKRAEASAFKSELRYHRILDAMMEGCQIIDFDWKYVYVNEVVISQGRHTREELLNHTMIEMYPGIKRTEMFAMLLRCMEDREPKKMENQFIFPDGRFGWFELSIQPAEEGIFILSTDITERKLAERQLLESERRYRELVQNANSAILRWKSDGTIAFFNEYAQSLFGYTLEEILGKDVNILVPKTESTGGDLSKLVESIVEHPEQFINVVNENICQDGHRVWMTWTNKPTYDENGDVSEILAVGVDITERKQAEMALLDSEERLRLSLYAANQGLYDLNVQSGEAVVNREYAEMLGYDFDTFVETNAAWIERLHPDDLEVTSRAYANYISGLSPEYRVEFRQRTKDGTWKWILSLGRVVEYSTEGKPLRMMGTHTDITERKHTEQEVRRLNEDLEARVIERTSQLAAANKELESFSYSVSHDLRAPLRAINGYTNILVDEYGSHLDQEGRRICSIISRETKQMGRLIDDLLSFSHMGRREMNIQPIDMKNMVDSVLDELLKGEDRSRIDVRVGELLPTTGDAALIRQVWINLLSNAIKFTSRKARAVIQVESSKNEEGVVYSVRDNGAGFDMEYANKLFGVFQRLHSESEFDGTGVGLAIVQRVIHRHGGRVWAEGVVDEGATFQFLLPGRNESK